MAVLLVLLAIQVSVITFRTVTQGIEYTPLAVGEQLPYSISAWPPYSGSERNAASSRCHVAFICSTGCGVCSALADRYVEETRSGFNGVRPLWFLGGNSARVASWAIEHGLPRERVLTLAPKKRQFWRPPVYGDLWSTPTRVVLTSELLVRDARPSNVLLSLGELESLCDSGGIAPQGLKELARISHTRERKTPGRVGRRG